jgi:hypothetical protein
MEGVGLYIRKSCLLQSRRCLLEGGGDEVVPRMELALVYT